MKKNKKLVISILVIVVVLLTILIEMGSDTSWLGVSIVGSFLIIVFSVGLLFYVFKDSFPKKLVCKGKRNAFIAYALFINFLGVAYGILFFEGIKNWSFFIILFLAVGSLYLSLGEYSKDKSAHDKVYDFLYSLSAGFTVGTIGSIIDLCYGAESYLKKTKQEIWFEYFDIGLLIITTVLFVSVSIYIVESNSLKNEDEIPQDEKI